MPLPFVIEPTEVYRLPLESVTPVTVMPGSCAMNRTTFVLPDTEVVQDRVWLPAFLSQTFPISVAGIAFVTASVGGRVVPAAASDAALTSTIMIAQLFTELPQVTVVPAKPESRYDVRSPAVGRACPMFEPSDQPVGEVTPDGLAELKHASRVALPVAVVDENAAVGVDAPESFAIWDWTMHEEPEPFTPVIEKTAPLHPAAPRGSVNVTVIDVADTVEFLT